MRGARPRPWWASARARARAMRRRPGDRPARGLPRRRRAGPARSRRWNLSDGVRSEVGRELRRLRHRTLLVVNDEVAVAVERLPLREDAGGGAAGEIAGEPRGGNRDGDAAVPGELGQGMDHGLLGDEAERDGTDLDAMWRRVAVAGAVGEYAFRHEHALRREPGAGGDCNHGNVVNRIGRIHERLHERDPRVKEVDLLELARQKQ